MDPHPSSGLLRDLIDREIPDLPTRQVRGKDVYLTGSAELATIRKLVGIVAEHRKTDGGEWGYQVNSATMEQVFLDLNAAPPSAGPTVEAPVRGDIAGVIPLVPGQLERRPSDSIGEKDIEAPSPPSTDLSPGITLSSGTKRGYFASIPADAWTIFRKRLIIVRRSWLLPLIGIIVVVCASCVPLFFLKGRQQTCAFVARTQRLQHLSYPSSIYPLAFSPVVLSPQTALGSLTPPSSLATTERNNDTWVNLFSSNYTKLSYGGISLSTPISVGPSTFAWEGTTLTQKGQSALNFLTNSMLDQISPPTTNDFQSYFRINLDFRFLASPVRHSQTCICARWS